MAKQIMIYPYNGITVYNKKKMDYLLIHTTIWINLKNIILNERNQKQREYLLYGFIYIKLESWQN